MRFLSSGIFWGFIVILFGVGILLKSVFHVNIPFFKILIGIIVILFGVSIIFNAINSTRRNNTVFREYNFNFGTIEKEYNIVFSKGVFDFTNFNFSNYNGKFVKINSDFSKSEIYLSLNFEYEIRADSVFGVVRLPNGESVSFGNIARLENAENSGLKRINLHVSSVFSETKILFK